MARQPDRTRYRRRLSALLASPPTFGGDPASTIENQAHWAKYACVLVSGFVEQAIKEILVSYGTAKAAPAVSSYIEKTWPSSRNMNAGNIGEILGNFDQGWEAKFKVWLEEADERKSTINSLISWRNNIAHGNEANTTGVTMNSVQSSFQCACKLVDFVEGLVVS